jgi:membrane associated rhomboid family serine protease
MSGLALVVAGAMFVVAELISLSVLAQGDVDDLRQIAGTNSFLLQSFSTLVGGIFLLGGLVGLYVRQSEVAEKLGVVSFLLAFLGTALVVGAFYANTFITPLVALEAPSFLDSPLAGVLKVWLPFDFVLLAVSWLALCVANVRARVYPRGASWLLLAGAVLALLPLPLVNIVFETALVWLGLALLKGSGISGGGAARRGKRSRQRARAA